MENEELKTTPENKEQELKQEADVKATETEKEEEQRPTITLPEKKENPNTVIVDGIEYPKDIVEKARNQGWKGKEELGERGSKVNYLPPDKFVEKGEEYSPFVRKKMKKLEEENEKMSKLLQKKLLEDSKDRLQTVKTQMKNAKDSFELDGYDDLVARKIQIEQEIESYNQNLTEKKVETQAIAPEIEEWNNKNIWSIHTFSDGTKNPYYDSVRTAEANQIFNEIQSHNPTWSMDRILATVDYNLQTKTGIAKQKANLIPPVTASSQAVTPPVNRRSFDNLKPEMKRVFEKCNNDGSGHEFTGSALKRMKQTFLAECDDGDFKF